MSKIKQSTLIFIRGLPGSGKSYLAKHLVRLFDPSTVVVLDPDLVDQSSTAYKEHVKEQVRENVDPKLHLYRFSRAQAFQAAKNGKIIIWDQPFNDFETFKKVYERFREYATTNGVELKIVVVEVEIDPVLAEKRVRARKLKGGHGPSSDTFSRFVQNFESFEERGYDLIKVNGVAPISDSLEIIKKSCLINGETAMI